MKNALRNHFYFTAGIGFLALAKAAHLLRGYKTPRPFSDKDVDQAASYALRVVEEWGQAANRVTGEGHPFWGRRILELGPGADLGVAVTLLAQGARSYSALDVNKLALTPKKFLYSHLYKRTGLNMQTEPESFEGLSRYEEVIDAVALAQAGLPTPLINYQVRDDFDLVKAFPDTKFDMFVSQAAFEHFDDPEKTIRDMSTLASDTAQVILAIDLKTHGRWIRDKDPLNIYRYPNWLYKLLSFRGSPTRSPVSCYVEALRRNGWHNVTVEGAYPVEDFDSVRPYLNKRFQKDETKHQWIVVCAHRTPIPVLEEVENTSRFDARW